MVTFGLLICFLLLFFQARIERAGFEMPSLAWIFQELEAFIGKAFKGAAVLGYRKALITIPPARPQGENFLAAFGRMSG
jgi:hypothetical protein